MFTGIIEEVGRVVKVRAGSIRIRADRVADGTTLGQSIAIDGVDLTVFEIIGSEMAFNVMPETYRQSTLGHVAAGAQVNLERSLHAEDRLSGHVVRGVVEGTGRLEDRREDGDATILTYSAPDDLLARMVERGPITVDGISLTVINKTERTFSVSIVQYTGEHTNALERKIGDPVNIETDIMMRYVIQAVQASLGAKHG
jgi:riboflavin synthase